MARTQVSEQEARAVAEAARETEWSKPSFVRELFLGRLRMELIDPLPQLDPAEVTRAAEYLERVDAWMREHVDGAEVERTSKVPPEIVKGMAGLGLMGLKIPREYGGLGFSQRTYNQVVSLVGRHCTALGVLLSAHQSIGVPQPLKLFGTPEQKKKYLPRLAKGAVSAFALTEPDVGSDPARMGASAEPTDDGSAYILNGEKLWCTNGPIAELMVVMARTPARDGSGRRGITAFIVESDWPGVETEHRCEFMGLRGIENGLMRFTNVRVPKENVLWGEGKGLKLALITLNTGRLTIPATCAAAGRWCLEVVREWGNERQQWGSPVGKHEAVAQMIADIAARTFAMEAINEVSARLADAGKSDIRLEAAIAKMWNSESAWRMVDETMQVRGGRGYETAASLGARGEEALPVEQLMRDLRINLIFEGSSEIMRLFIAREAVDPHLQHAGALVQRDASTGAKAKGAVGMGMHFAAWYPRLLMGWGQWPRYADYGPLAAHVRFADRGARRLARALFYAMSRYGPKLEKKQAVLFRIVDIGAELFAIAAACVQARTLARAHPDDRSAYTLADLFCRHARRRVNALFRGLLSNSDPFTYRVSQEILAGKHTWLEGRLGRTPGSPRPVPSPRAEPSPDAGTATAVGAAGD